MVDVQQHVLLQCEIMVRLIRVNYKSLMVQLLFDIYLLSTTVLSIFISIICPFHRSSTSNHFFPSYSSVGNCFNNVQRSDNSTLANRCRNYLNEYENSSGLIFWRLRYITDVFIGGRQVKVPRQQ